MLVLTDLSNVLEWPLRLYRRAPKSYFNLIDPERTRVLAWGALIYLLEAVIKIRKVLYNIGYLNIFFFSPDAAVK